jgi:hypothetical protein
MADIGILSICEPRERLGVKKLTGMCDLSLELLADLQCAQRLVYGELSMPSVDATNWSESLDHIEQSYLGVLRERKVYYAEIYLLMFNPHGLSESLTTDLLKTRQIPAPSPSPLQFPTIDELGQVFLTPALLAIPSLLDALSFTIIPALFHFFTTETSVNSYIDLLTRILNAKLPREHKRLAFLTIARSSFFSPDFVKFIQTVIRPIISRIAESELEDTGVSSLREPIAAAWGANQSLIPAHVARVINLSSRLPSLSNPTHILVDGFFGPGLKSESSAQVAGFFEFNQPPSASVMGGLRALFVGSSDFVASLPFPENSPVYLSVEQARRCHISDEVQLVSDLDLAVARGEAVELPERFELRRGPKIAHPVSFPVRLTALGRLLGELDAIPTFSDENLPLCSVESFLCDLAVGFGRSETTFIRFESLEEVRSSGILRTSEGLKMGLQECFVRQTEGHNLGTLTADCKGALYRIRRSSVESCEITNLFLGLNFFASSRAGSADLVSFLRQIRASPDDRIGSRIERFLEQFLSLPFGMFDTPIALAFAPHGESFEGFRKINPDLSVYDERVRETLGDRDWLNRFIREYRRQLPRGAWVKKRFRELRSADGILGRARDAALEPTAYRKEIEFMRGCHELREFFESVAPPGTLWGEDHHLPLRLVYLILANPPYFVSNLAFLDACSTSHGMGLAGHIKLVLRLLAEDKYEKVIGEIHLVPPPFG